MTFASGSIAALFDASPLGADDHDMTTVAVPRLDLDFDGIPGERHAGRLRLSGGREPWLPRGTALRNDRQLSALCPTELAAVARALGLDELKPEWLGANLLVAGFAAFSRIPPGAKLAVGGAWAGKGRFDGTAILRVEAYNHPCRKTGRCIAQAVGRPDLEFAFVKAAAALRGLVLSVDLPGALLPGQPVLEMPPIVPPAGR